MKKSITKIKLDSIYKSFKIERRNKILNQVQNDTKRVIHVLDGVSLDVKAGEFVSIVGPSGCGKTTLLNIIVGLIEQDKGSIKFKNIPSDKRLGRIAYIQQKDLLFPWRSVVDNAILGLELEGISKSVAREKAMSLMDTFGLKGFENQYPSVLSGGMRQRLAFLRTMLIDQDIMLLDEPFGALDKFTRTKMQKWLEALWRRFNKTIILVTHDVEEAILLSDRIYVLSARPAKVTRVLSVSLPRPRTYKMVTKSNFNSIKKILIDNLYKEIT